MMNLLKSLALTLITVALSCHIVHCKLTNSTKYTQREQHALVKFRDMVRKDLYKDYMMSDIYLIRWLRVRDFDFNKAAVMLRKALQWRKENDIDNILNKTIIEFKNPPFYIDGFGYEGVNLITAIVARVDLRSLLVAGKRKEMISFFHQLLETAENQIMRRTGQLGNDSAAEGNDTDKGIAIFDLTGYNLRQHACLACFGVYTEWFRVFENFYPGYLKYLIYINSPRIFGPMLEFLKPLMSKSTRDGLRVYGTNKMEWRNALLKEIPADQLRPQFGGTKDAI